MIHKHLIPWEHASVPGGCRVDGLSFPLHVAVVGNGLYVWGIAGVAVNPITVYVLGTGRVPHFDMETAGYLGTVHVDGFVWHVFWRAD